MKKKIDIFVLAILLVIAIAVSFFTSPSLLVSIIFFYGFPSLWLAFRAPQHIKRASIFAFLATILFFIADYVAVLDGAWWVSTIFPIRLLNILPIEDSIWCFVGTFLIVLCYEYFFDNKKKHSLFDAKIKSFIESLLVLAIFLVAGFMYFPEILKIPYAYFWIGLILGILPVATVLFLHPSLGYKFLMVNTYIILIHAPFEISALQNNQWSFPGENFIGWVHVYGVSFPVEEFVIYILMTGIIILSYYHLFDHKYPRR